MLSPGQIDALNILCERAVEPVTEFLLKDIARRIARAGQFTSSAAYQMWKLQELNMSRKQIEKELRKRLNVSQKELEKLIKQSAEVGYNFDISHLPSAAIPFSENESLQQIIKAAVELADKEFKNITQTLGMVDPHGKPLPLKDVYNSCCDFAFNQVVTGATDYNTAIRRACKNLANEGLRRIDYESGVHTSLEAAVRRNIMGGLGLMQEKISQENHDKFGANGWEISAHAASAPDHEPIQGKQYTDEEYNKLNNSLVRRIGTLNCGHAAFPIILGVSEPTYTDEQLEEFKRSNAEGVTYQGKHYTMYEATQKQRQIERAIRTQKRRVLIAETTGSKERLLISQIKYRRLNEEYDRFSKGVKLRTQPERLEVVGFGRKQAVISIMAAKNKAISQAGGKYTVGDIEWVERRLKEAQKYYDQARNSNDIELIAKVSGMTVEEIRTIKNHIFFDRHILYDGEFARFDADYDMAVAWKRLSEGVPEKRDFLLLQHELLESQIEKRYNVTASKAHEEANKLYPWDKKLLEELGEGGEKDGILYPEEKK